MSAGRYWIFQEFLDEHVQKYEKWFSDIWKNGNISYICGQQEQNLRSGKLYINGYVVFRTIKKLSEVKKELLSEGIHVNLRFGDHEGVIKWCRNKESRMGRFIFIGKHIDECKEENEIKNDDSMIDIANDHPGISQIQ